MNVITIKPAQRSAEEWLSLQVLYLTSRQQTFIGTDTSSCELSDFDRDTAGEHILVAASGEAIVGFISIWLPDSFIHHFYVDRNVHNKGIGSRLLKAAIAVTGLPVRLKCLAKNIHALTFYLKKGFTVVSKGVSSEGEYVLMELIK